MTDKLLRSEAGARGAERQLIDRVGRRGVTTTQNLSSACNMET
jgi:hypothetical protein